MIENDNDKARRLLTAKDKSKLPRRFYKKVGTSVEDGVWHILLDGRAVKTPMKVPLALPNGALAEAVVAEWEAQGEHIDPAAMHCTKLSNTAIDRVAERRSAIISEIGEFAATDLVCYRADSPEGLVELQNETWDPLLAWMAKEIGARFVAVTGLVHEPQPDPTLRAIDEYLGRCGDFTLTALHNLTTLTGSCVLAVALHEKVIAGEDGWAAAHVDEDWQNEHWGSDEEAELRRAHYKREFDATLGFLELAADC